MAAGPCLDSRPPDHLPRHRPGPSLPAHLVHDLVELTAAAGAVDALLRVRATQSALFRGGLLLHHEPRLATICGQGLSCPLTEQIAASLHRAVSTTVAAAAVVDLVYPAERGLPADHPSTWQLASVEPDGSHLHTPHGSIPVPACGQPILRAHLNWLNRAGPAAGDTVLFDERRQRLDQIAHHAMRLLNPTGAVGVRYRRSRAYLPGHATAWMRQRGMELSAMATLVPGPTYG